MSEKTTLPVGVLPNITDTDPPPIHEDTVYGPPSCIDIPHVTQEGATLSCTMGNWTSKPESYAYQWQIDGDDVGDNAPTYETGPSEQGKVATCIVTATNDLGSTAAPPGGPVTVESAMRRHPQQEREHGHGYAQERAGKH